MEDSPRFIKTVGDLRPIVCALEDTFLISGIYIALKTRYNVDWIAVIDDAAKSKQNHAKNSDGSIDIIYLNFKRFEVVASLYYECTDKKKKKRTNQKELKTTKKVAASVNHFTRCNGDPTTYVMRQMEARGLRSRTPTMSDYDDAAFVRTKCNVSLLDCPHRILLPSEKDKKTK